MGLDVGVDQPQCLEFFQAFQAQHFGAGVVAATVLFDDLRRRLQRPVRGGKRQVGEEWSGLVALLEVVQQLVAEGIGGIEILGQLLDEPVVFDVQRRGGLEQARGVVVIGRLEAVVVGRPRQQRERALETAGVGRQFGGQAQVPLAAHQCLVTGLAQQLRQCHHLVIQVALVAGLADQLRRQRLGHGADTGDMVVGAGEQHRAGRRARRGGVEVGQAQAVQGECVQVRRGNFPAKRTEVREAHVIGQDHEKIGTLRHQGTPFFSRQ